jgi:glutamyl-tRNA synthetase
MVMGKDGQKLSKRHGSTSVRDFRAKGYLPEALMNYVSLVGWSYDGQTEFFSKEELEKVFSLEKINKAPGVFDYKKLDWFNGQYIRRKSDAELAPLLVPYLQEAGLVDTPPTISQQEIVDKMVPVMKERLKVLSDIVDLSRFLFVVLPPPSVEELLPKNQDAATTLKALEEGYAILRSGLEDELSDETIEQALSDLAGKLAIKVNGVFMPIRVAVTGSSVSPPLFDSIRLVGFDKTFARIERAIEILKDEVHKNG